MKPFVLALFLSFLTSSMLFSAPKSLKKGVDPSVVVDTMTYYNDEGVRTKRIGATDKINQNRIWEEFHFQDPDSKRWSPSDRGEYVYNQAGSITSESYYKWNPRRKNWMGDERFTNTYNEQNQETQKIGYAFDVKANTWLPKQKVEFDYDKNGSQQRVTYSYFEPTVAKWIGDTQMVSRRDSVGNPIEICQFTWDNTAALWRNEILTVNEFEERIRVSEANHIWNVAAKSWIPEWKKVYVRDAEGRETEKEFYRWDAKGVTWVLMR